MDEVRGLPDADPGEGARYPDDATAGFAPPPLPAVAPRRAYATPYPEDDQWRDPALATGLSGAEPCRTRLSAGVVDEWSAAHRLHLRAPMRYRESGASFGILDEAPLEVTLARIPATSMNPVDRPRSVVSRLRMLHLRSMPKWAWHPIAADWYELGGRPAILDRFSDGAGGPVTGFCLSAEVSAEVGVFAFGSVDASRPKPLSEVAIQLAAAGTAFDAGLTWWQPPGWSLREDLILTTDNLQATATLEPLVPGWGLAQWRDEVFRRAPFLRDLRQLGDRTVVVPGLDHAVMERFDWQPMMSGRVLTTVVSGVVGGHGFSFVLDIPLHGSDQALLADPDRVLSMIRCEAAGPAHDSGPPGRPDPEVAAAATAGAASASAGADMWAPRRAGPTVLDHLRSGAGAESQLPGAKRDDGRFAPGALIGVMSQHARESSDPKSDDAIAQVLDCLQALAAGTLDRPTLERTYDATLGLLDPDRDLGRALAAWIVSEPHEMSRRRASAIAELGEWLIIQGQDPGPVRVGITLVSVVPRGLGQLEAIESLGRHEELALSAITGLGRLRRIQAEGRDVTAEVNAALLRLGRGHHGWGRIHAVAALAGQTDDPAIRRWLLQEGVRNRVHRQYSAMEIAMRADLAGALKPVAVRAGDAGGLTDEDRALAAGARDIIAALLDPNGPGGDLDDYPDASQVVDDWLGIVRAMDAGTLEREDLSLVLKLLGEADLAWGWGGADTRSTGRDVRDYCTTILAEPAVADRVQQGLAGSEPTGWAPIASAIGLDSYPAMAQHLRAHPDDSFAWWTVCTAKPVHVQGVVDLALELLPSDGAGRTPAQVVGGLPGPHFAVRFLLQQVAASHPVEAFPLIRRYLGSPMKAVRGLAFRALCASPRDRWHPDAEAVLRQAQAREPEDGLREEMSRALA